MKYFIYARKSTDDERQILSIDAQLDELRMMAAREKWKSSRIYRIADGEEAGPTDASMKCSRRSNGAKAQAILAWHPDRLARIRWTAGA